MPLGKVDMSILLFFEFILLVLISLPRTLYILMVTSFVKLKYNVFPFVGFGYILKELKTELYKLAVLTE